MAITKTRITGDVTRLTGEEPTNIAVKFTLSKSAMDEVSEEIILKETIEVTPDADGIFFADLWPTDRAISDKPHYTLDIISGAETVYKQDKLFVPSWPTELSLAQIINLTTTATKPSVLSVDQVLNVINGTTAPGDVVAEVETGGPFRASVSVPNGQGYFLGSGSQIVLAAVPPGGEYNLTVVATSIAGSGQGQFSFTLNQAPDQFAASAWTVTPTPDLEADNATLEILTVPSSGDSPVTDIEYRVNGGIAQSTGLSEPGTFVLTLPIEATSPIEIRALNQYGAGAWSAAKDVTTDYSQADPFRASDFTVIDAAATSGDQVTLAINTLPNDNGNPITDIEAQVDDGAWMSIGGTATGIYTIAVATFASGTLALRSINSEGPSVPFEKPYSTRRAPNAFTVGDWSLSSDTQAADTLLLTITNLPANGGEPITALEYRIDGTGAWASISGTAPGEYEIAVLGGEPRDIQIRSVNVFGASAASDTKTATPIVPFVTIDDFSRDRVVHDHGGAKRLAAKQSVDALSTTAGADPSLVDKVWGVDPAPAGVTVSGGIMTVGAGVALEGWRIDDLCIDLETGASLNHCEVIDTRTGGSGIRMELISIPSNMSDISVTNCTIRAPVGYHTSGTATRIAIWAKDNGDAFPTQMPDNVQIENNIIECAGVNDPLVGSFSNSIVTRNLIRASGNAPAVVEEYDPNLTYNIGQWATNSSGEKRVAVVNGITGIGNGPPENGSENGSWQSPHCDGGTFPAFDNLELSYNKFDLNTPQPGYDVTGVNNGPRLVAVTGHNPTQGATDVFCNIVLRPDWVESAAIEYQARVNAVGPVKIYDNWITPNVYGGAYYYGPASDLIWQDNVDYYDGTPAETPNGDEQTEYGLSNFLGADIPISGTSTFDEPLEARVLNESATAVVDWSDVAVADGAGDWSGTVRCDLDLDWLTVEVRLKNSPGTTAATSNTFGVGIGPLSSEQSNIDIWGFGNSTGNIETIGNNGDNFQYFRIINRGAVGGSDAGSTIEGPIFVTDANPVNNAVAAMAAFYHKNYPGLKVQWLFDVKPGVSEDATLNDDDIRRDFDSITKLKNAALGDGQKIGIKTFTHYDSLDASQLATYLAGSYFGKDLDGEDVAGIDPNAAFADVSVGGKTINHIWAEAFPEMRSGDAPLLPMIEGALWSNGSYPNSADNWRTQHRLAAASLPTYFLPHVEHTITSKGGTTGSDNTHLDTEGLYGFQNKFRAIAAAVGRAYGLTPFKMPTLDRRLWTKDYVEVWSSAGPVTTVERAQAAEEARPAVNYPADPVGAPSTPGNVEVFGFTQQDQLSEVTRTEIVAYDGSGTPALSGRIRIYPESGDFTATSRIYYNLGRASLTGLTIEDANLDICRHMLIQDVGLAGQTIEYGWPVQPLDDVEFINDGNSIAPPEGADPVTYTEENLVYNNANLTGSKLTLEMAMHKVQNSGEWDVVQGSDDSSFYYQVYMSTSNGGFVFKFDNNSGTTFNGRVNFKPSLLTPVNGVVPRFRVTADLAASAQEVRLFFTPPSTGVEVEITSASQEIDSALNDEFGVSGAITAPGTFHGGLGLRFFDATGYDVAYFRAWPAIQANGGTDTLGAPWAEAVSDGAGGYTTSGLTLVE